MHFLFNAYEACEKNCVVKFFAEFDLCLKSLVLKTEKSVY